MNVLPDPWLSDILHCKAMQVTYANNSDAILPHYPDAFYYTKISSNNPAAVNTAIKDGFRFITTQLTFRRAPELIPQTLPITIKPPAPEDCEQVARIAESCFVHDRFHADPKIKKEIADEIKRQWVVNYFNGTRGESILVAYASIIPVGFLTISKTGNAQSTTFNTRTIDLIGVLPSFQSMGIGTELVRRFISDSVGACQSLSVGTQITNLTAIRMYEKLRFTVGGADYILHKWT